MYFVRKSIIFQVDLYLYVSYLGNNRKVQRLAQWVFPNERRLVVIAIFLLQGGQEQEPTMYGGYGGYGGGYSGYSPPTGLPSPPMGAPSPQHHLNKKPTHMMQSDNRQNQTTQVPYILSHIFLCIYKNPVSQCLSALNSLTYLKVIPIRFQEL